LIEYLSTLNWVDYVIIGGFVRGCYVGYRDGILRELVRLVVIALAIFSAVQFSAPLAQLITLRTFLSYALAKSLSLFVIGVSTLVVLWFISGLLLRFLDVGQSIFVRVLGLLVGMCRWAFILSVLFSVIMASDVGSLRSDIAERSHWGASVQGIAPLSLEFMSSFLS